MIILARVPYLFIKKLLWAETGNQVCIPKQDLAVI